MVLTLMVYMAVLSATLAIRKRSHIRMTAFDKYLPKKALLTLDLLADIAVLALGVVLLITCVYLLILGRASGLAGILALVAWVVLFSLFTALIAVSANWIMTVPAMLVILLLCVLAFLYGLILLYDAMAGQIKRGRSARAAYADACRRQGKWLAIFYGVIAALGLLLMLIFQAGIYGVLGRFLMVGALLSLAALFLFLRVVLSCAAALANKK